MKAFIPIILLMIVPAMAQDAAPAVGPTPDELETENAVKPFKPKFAEIAARADLESNTKFHKFVRLPNRIKTKDDPLRGGGIDVSERDDRFNWRGAMIQSGLFLAIQHGYRMTEEKTRTELNGPFLRDWKESLENLHGWYDGGRLFTDYVAHPMQGAVTARIFINNSGRSKGVEYGLNKRYWKTRVKSLVWATLWSTQFEIGPLSEASLGNIGQHLYERHKSKLTYGDMIVTPIAGVGWTVGEDAMDKFVLHKWIERKVSNRIMIKILRSILTPTTSFANILRGKAPWRRDYRRN